MNICFLMNDWNGIDPETNSSIRVIHEAVSRGHNVGILYSQNLTVRDNVVCGFVQLFARDQKVPENIPTFHRKAKFTSKLLPLKGFDVIFLIRNPPLDWLTINFLDSLKNDVLIINTVDGIRKANNKLYTTTLEEAREFIPETHVSKNIKFLLDVVKNSKKDKLILKPLSGYGGHGVILLEKKAMQSIRSLLEFYIHTGAEKNYVILQEYVDGAEEGDTRILLLGGEPIGAYRRVPSEMEIRSNINAGGSAVKHTLTRQEKELCRKIGPKLLADGIIYAGLDVIRGKLIEVNVLSPGGITRINKFNRTKLQKKVLDYVETQVLRADRLIQERAELKDLVNNAHIYDSSDS